MTTRLFLKGLAAVVVGLMSAAPAGAADKAGALAACWPQSALAGRPSERVIARGGPGHVQRIPAVTLAAATPVPANLRGAVRRVNLPKGRKLVALTLDLCEQPGEIAGYDGGIVDYLRANKIKATFFSGGHWLMTHAERGQQLIADPLFEIGSHGWGHRNVRGLTGRSLTDEIRGPLAAYAVQRETLITAQCTAPLPGLAASLPKRLGLYRFPYGACNPEALATLASEGMLAIQWDVSTGDASPAESAKGIADAMVNEVRPGSIILAHANGRGYHTAEALPIAIPKLRAKGYEFVTVSELMAAGEPVIVDTCYDRRPGDTDRYDYVFSRKPEASRATTSKPAADAARSSPVPR
jgi:peptidoglycan/xylan/chitin deacetylase (PgdA/CDA1 family)